MQTVVFKQSAHNRKSTPDHNTMYCTLTMTHAHTHAHPRHMPFSTHPTGELHYHSLNEASVKRHQTRQCQVNSLLITNATKSRLNRARPLGSKVNTATKEKQHQLILVYKEFR